MASPGQQQSPVTPETLINIKMTLNHGAVRKLKLPLKDLGASTLPAKLRQHLDLKPEQVAIFERFSDSAGNYVVLDPTNPTIFKTLIRAAKAKLKLRLKATVPSLLDCHVPDQEKTEPDNSSWTTLRASTALDRRSIGSGIFHYREARASQATLVESPNPITNTLATPIVGELKEKAVPAKTLIDCSVMCPADKSEELPAKPKMLPAQYGSHWSVYCNECDSPTGNTHFHCNICDKGDFDLCVKCVDAGKLCPGEGHWLIKRVVKDGVVVNSQTQRLSTCKPLLVSREVVTPNVSAAVKTLDTTVPFSDVKSVTKFVTRTCNNCIIVLPEDEFVNCTVCDDFDLCMQCHVKNAHGHHPGHRFEKATPNTDLSVAAKAMLEPGRNTRHDAICDGCDSQIYGVRHKCQTCPDFDLCGTCVKEAYKSHPRHRFGALYDRLAIPQSIITQHFGIYCDGPNCINKANQSYITGPRYKCAVCNDTDFCAACEASPHNTHNRTHPVILFKTPIRDVKITTQNEDVRGNIRTMGDREVRAASTTQPAQSAPSEPNLKTKLQVLADYVPSSPTNLPQKDTVQVQYQPFMLDGRSTTGKLANWTGFLNAHFVQDSIPDGMKVTQSSRFTQIWTLRNPGPFPWPAGCSVRFVGGDNMLNLDTSHPTPLSDVAEASESNVIGREVQVNEEIAFRVTLKAPSRTGRAISYWRLKAEDGHAFGHRLWCDIDVQPKFTSTALPIRNLLAPEPEDSTKASSPHSSSSPAISAPTDYQDYIQQEMQQREQLKSHFKAYSEASINAQRGMLAQKEEAARKEAAKLRVEYIKAKILKAREERAKTIETTAALQLAYAKQMQNQLADQIANNTKDVEEASDDTATSESQMIFPKLEKESPESSTYESLASSQVKSKSAYVENDAGEEEDLAPPTVPVSAPVAQPSPSVTGPETFEDVTEELEVLSAASEDFSDSDDGFLTDEEYDILDASDRETLASP